MTHKDEFTLSIPSFLLKSQNINNGIVALTIDLDGGWGRACTLFLDAALRVAGKQELRGQMEDLLMAETPYFEIARIEGVSREEEFAQDVLDRFPREDWRCDVANNDTSLGYEEWVAHNVESEKEDIGKTATPSSSPKG